MAGLACSAVEYFAVAGLACFVVVAGFDYSVAVAEEEAGFAAVVGFP